MGYNLVNMIHVFYGSDIGEVMDKTNEAIAIFQSKESETTLIVFEDDNFNEAQFVDIVSGGQGLFGQQCAVIFRSVFDNTESKYAILSRLDDMKKSTHLFVFSEKKLDASTTALFKKAGVIMKECSGKEKKTSEKSFVSFAIADAFGKRDKKRAWAIFHKEIKGGSSAESLHGILFWQIKNMLLASSYSSAECARTGMKPFVFSKARASAKNFSKEELRALSAGIVSI